MVLSLAAREIHGLVHSTIMDRLSNYIVVTQLSVFHPHATPSFHIAAHGSGLGMRPVHILSLIHI